MRGYGWAAGGGEGVLMRNISARDYRYYNERRVENDITLCRTLVAEKSHFGSSVSRGPNVYT